MTDVPVGVRDQFMATLRDDFGKLDLDVDDPKTAEAAFAGAMILADAVFSEPVASVRVAQFAAYLLRNLSVRATGASTPLAALPTMQTSWRTRIMDWLYR